MFTANVLLRLRSLNCFESTNGDLIRRISGYIAAADMLGLVGCTMAALQLGVRYAAPSVLCPVTCDRCDRSSIIPSSPRFIMSTAPSTSTSHSNFLPIFNAALQSYKRKTKKDLPSHPLLSSLQSCNSPEAVLTVLREQIPAFNQSQNQDDGFTNWVTPTVNVLYTFSATVGQGVGLVNINLFSREEYPL
jgi:hypothetical protein